MGLAEGFCKQYTGQKRTNSFGIMLAGDISKNPGPILVDSKNLRLKIFQF